MADGKVVFEIQGDPKGIKTTLKDVTNDIEKESKKWDTAAGDAASGASGAWSAACGKIVGALSAAGVASILMNWGRAAISAASDLAEVQNVVDVTFGEGASKIESWSKTAGKQFGLTETQAKKFTSTLGAMMKSQGIADKEIVQMSTDLAGLAADMASFYNLDFEEAFNKIRSGISGETEPLKQLGINMSAANLEAFRLEKGITKAYTAMSQSEQTALRYEYIMRATADAQGDFARTADGFANASRRMETAMETIKTKGGELLLTVFEPLVNDLASFLSMLTEEPETTVLDDFTSIDTKTNKKVAEIQKTAAEAGYLTETLDDLASKTNKTEEEQKLWLETCKRLVATIPGLSSIINVETGEIKGGTQAVKDYVKAWEEGQTKLAMLGAIQQKEEAISSRFADIPGLQLDMAVAEKRVRDQMKKLDAIKAKYGLQTNGYNQIIKTNAVGGAGNLTAEEQEWNDAIAALGRLRAEEAKATESYTKQKEALEYAEQALEEYKQVVEEMPGDVDAGTEAVETQNTALAETVDTAKQALQAVKDYADGVRASVLSSVDSTIRGFDRLVRPTEELRKKQSDLIEQLHNTKKGTAEYAALQKQIEEVNKALSEYGTGGMRTGLSSQLSFMEEYMANLEKAQKMGLSNELLASLSDGSVDSAAYLAELVSDPQAAREVDALFQQVQAKKKEFTDALTDQKLAADETYTGLVENAKKALGDLNMQDTAKNAMLATVQGLADGIWAGFPDFKAAVDAIVGQMNRLAGPASGEADLTLDGSNAKGLDYVPFDGYLSELHEGEGILTAEENRIWQRFKNGGASSRNVDYDALGATMRDNVKAGGNVYLDGRVVGSVISAQQGNSYRSMQRSGFQG